MIPPSTVSEVPVTQSESFEVRKSAARAMSSSRPRRFGRVLFPTSSTAFDGSGKATADSQMRGVSTGPGHSRLTRTFGP